MSGYTEESLRQKLDSLTLFVQRNQLDEQALEQEEQALGQDLGQRIDLLISSMKSEREEERHRWEERQQIISSSLSLMRSEREERRLKREERNHEISELLSQFRSMNGQLKSAVSRMKLELLKLQRKREESKDSPVSGGAEDSIKPEQEVWRDIVK